MHTMQLLVTPKHVYKKHFNEMSEIRDFSTSHITCNLYISSNADCTCYSHAFVVTGSPDCPKTQLWLGSFLALIGLKENKTAN